MPTKLVHLHFNNVTRKAVNFQCVIIHVIIVGHSYFYDILCTCKLGAAKYGERVGPVNKLQWTSILDSMDLYLFRTSKSCNFRGLVWAYKFISNWQYFAEWTKCHVYTWFCSAIWLYRQSKVPEVDNFSCECYQAPSSPVFEKGAWGRGYHLNAYKIPVLHSHIPFCKSGRGGLVKAVCCITQQGEEPSTAFCYMSGDNNEIARCETFVKPQSAALSVLSK